MATLFNTKIKDTYQSLLKLEDNTILTTTTKNITDGLGNASPLFMSTTQVRIGSTSGNAMYWDNVNNRLGIGTSSPTQSIETPGAIKFASANLDSTVTLKAFDASTGNIDFTNEFIVSRQGTNLMKMFFNNRIAIGGAGSTAKLTVRGEGSTSATTSFLVQNSSGTESFRISDDRTTTINASDLYIKTSVGNPWMDFTYISGNPSITLRGNRTYLSSPETYVGALSLGIGGIGGTGTGIYSTGTDGSVVIGSSRGGIILKNYANSNIGLLNTDNPKNLVSIQQCGFQDGNTNGLTGNTLNIAPTYNFIGTINTVRGIYYNPTLTSLVSTTHIAIETVTGNVLFNTTSGNTLIGTTTDSGFKLDVNGTARTGNLTIGTSGQGTVTAGAINFLYPNTINYQTVYDFLIQPTSGTTGNLKFYGNYLELFGNNNSGIGLSFSTSTSNTVTIQKTQGGADSTKYLNISGSDQTNTAYSGGGGVVRIYGGLNNGTAAQGMVILAHDGTSARGNVGVGEASPTARLQIKGSGSTSATTSLLVQNSAANDLFKITDNGQVTIPPINASTISNLVINAGSLTNSTSAGIDLVGGQFAAQLYLKALGATTAGYPSALLGKVLMQAPTGLVITSNNAGSLSNTDIALYVYQSKSVHINGFTEVASAVLNVESTTKGFLPPRMTTAEKNLIASPATGLMVFDTDLVRPCFFNGATWITL
jgi:hypothetical protein